MEKRIKAYLLYCDEYIQNQHTNADIEEFKRDLLIQIGFFQHERLIHLIVTIAFAIFTIIGISLCLTVPSLSVLIMTLLFIILLIPYIRHYYILENGVQRLYKIYDSLLDILHQ